MCSHMGFNTVPGKKDKLIGGLFTIIFSVLIFIPNSLINANTWYSDKNPYISSIQFPHSFEGEFARDERVTLDQVNTMFFMMRDYKF